MADTQMKRMIVREDIPVLLVTDDDALACLISLEAHALALPLRVVRELALERVEQGQVLLLDLDAQGGIAAALNADADIFAGFCHRTAALPTILRVRVPHLLERPFLTAELRRLLQQLRSGDYPAMTARPMKMPHEAEDRTLFFRDEETVCVGDISVRLTSGEAEVLRCLLENRGQTVTRRMLADRLGRGGCEGNEVEVYLCYLRRKLEKPTGLRLITTVRGVGYRLEPHETK